MRTITTMLLASSLAFAEPPADSPTSVHLTPGQPAPFSGRLLADAEHVRSEKQCTDAVTFRKATEGNVMLSPAVVVAVVLGALATGAAVGVAVTVAAKR